MKLNIALVALIAASILGGCYIKDMKTEDYLAKKGEVVHSFGRTLCIKPGSLIK